MAAAAQAAAAGRRRSRGRAGRDRQAVPRRDRQPRHRHHHPRRHRPRPGRRERRRQVDADEDPVRRAEARRRHDRGRRRAEVTFSSPDRRDRARHRHGLPALHARRQPDRAGERRARRREAARHRRRRPAPRSSRSPSAYGFGLDPDELVETLGVGERQRVEILKVLYRGAQIIILDEPTAVLVPQEVDALFDNLRELKAEGHTLIFISHKLDEVLAIADDITVMRRGTTVGDGRSRHDVTKRAAGRADGRLASCRRPSTEESTVTDDVLLALAGRRRSPTSPAATCSTDISFDIHRGEVLGIAGVEGNGQTELVETMMGMRDASRRHASCSATRTSRAWDDPRAPRGRHRLHPRGPAPARAAARLAALGEPHPRPPDPAAERVKGGWIDRGGARADTERIVARVRRAHAGHRHARPGAVRRQPAEVHRRPRDERRPGRC